MVLPAGTHAGGDSVRLAAGTGGLRHLRLADPFRSSSSLESGGAGRRIPADAWILFLPVHRQVPGLLASSRLVYQPLADSSRAGRRGVRTRGFRTAVAF